MINTSVNYYQLKITLAETQPQIWRRFVVPKNITLDRLHDVIQIVMGWQDSHLHEFIFEGQRYTEFVDGIDEFDEYSIEDGVVLLADLLKKKGDSLVYVYDFGDYWQHEIVLENRQYGSKEDEELVGITCLEGHGTCPPEDVGGVGGYFELCRVLHDPKDPEYKETREWYESMTGNRVTKHFTSSGFDPYEVNERLMWFERWSRDRRFPWTVEPIPSKRKQPL